MKSIALIPAAAALLLTLLPATTAFAQFPGLKLPKVKLPSLDQALQEKPPVTTSLEDAVTEVPSLDRFDPQTAASMRELPRGLDGNYLLMPGVWEMEVRSYCLRAGTRAPSIGTGHSYAPLKGPKSLIVRHILQNSAAHPEIPQRDVQVLLWAIIARTKVSAMPNNYQKTAAVLLTARELLDLERNVMDVLTPQMQAKFFANLPGPVKQVLEAENQLRQKLTATTAAPYEELERIAVLAGVAPAEPGGREVRRGRWSYHPDNYFIRHFASSYSLTRIQVYVPAQPFRLEKDNRGQILRVVFTDSDRPLATQVASRTGAFTKAARSGSSRPLQPYKGFDPSDGLAVPPGGGQRLGQSSAKPGSGPSPDEQKTRDTISKMKWGRFGIGLLVRGPGFVPAFAFDKILDFNLTHGFQIARALEGDPPRPDYKTMTSVEKLSFTPLKAGNRVSAARAAALNAFEASSLDMNAKLRAATVAQDRQGGALQARDKEWTDLQAQEILTLKAESGKAMLITADRLEALVNLLRREGATLPRVTPEAARKYLARIRDTGFTAEEIQTAKQCGMTQAEIATLRADRGAASPEELTGDPLAAAADAVEVLRWYGNRFAPLTAPVPTPAP
ncbi:MAG: hypothetical protein H7Z41_13015 [Cytophagales bacterium]|nr:hypothetical protein [Armatimonadota bacterium]